VQSDAIADQISRACLRGRQCPPSLRRLCAELTAPEHGYPVTRLLTTLDVLDEGYGNAIVAEGEDIAANVRAHRRVFERLGFFAEDEDGALWAFDLAANREDPPVAALDTEGQYAWLGTDLSQVLAGDAEAASMATQFFPSLGQLQVRYYHEEKGAPLPPAQRSPRAAVANDPVSWLARPGAEVSATLAGLLPAREAIAACDDEGLVSTIWLPRGGPLARISVRGVALGSDAKALRQRFGAPSREGATWLRYDDDAVTLHFEVERGAVSRITLMAASRGV
jgi:hypothetical protein